MNDDDQYWICGKYMFESNNIYIEGKWNQGYAEKYWEYWQKE
jgi:hypothetical protein